jgi:hypothetical protein
VLFAKHTNLHLGVAFFLVNIDAQIAQLLNQCLNIFRLDLRQVYGNALLVHGQICLLQRRAWD